MKVIGIDTSCDDTSIAVLEFKGNKITILSNIVSSQIKVHQKYGGVYPSLAKREHQQNIEPVLKKVLKKAGLLEKTTNGKQQTANKFKDQDSRIQILKKILKREETLLEKLTPFFKNYKKPKIDLIAITTGPGLEPCLWIGINFARALSYWWNLPIVPVNHIEAHIAANWLSSRVSKIKKQEERTENKNQNLFPAIALVVSGGHTQLILMKDIGDYKIIGETKDDAAGECLDKTARILGLPYPGGPSISRQAKKLKKQAKGENLKIKLPRPMFYSKDYDFSFSGLKTAVLYNYKKQTKKNKSSEEYISLMAKEILQSVIDILIKKTIEAAKEYRAKSVILGGGVSANKELRKQFRLKIKNLKLKINFLAPPKNLCTDNAAMVAMAGYFNRQKRKADNWKKIRAKANLRLN